ncbi:MAG: hypothetical protein Q8N63_08395 [Nanoarchaeota archaeon]|nr:hypothetical protein [Nanoarchaeota archaeon]
MPDQYDDQPGNQLEEELEYARELALEGRAAHMRSVIYSMRKLAKKAGIDVSEQTAEIQNIGYRNGARLKLEDAKYLIEEGKKDLAKIALSLVQKYSSIAEDETTFFEAEEIIEDLKKIPNLADNSKTIELKVKEPDGRHGIGIEFEEKDDHRLVAAYNLSIRDSLGPGGIFHQTGTGNNPGYHYWEFLGSSPTQAEIKEMLPRVHQKAQESYKIINIV